ncbi:MULTISPECIES: gamma-butyrobetaine hydroxylase-like domain-containing protein [unclassified Labrys (in: a-proteobacteria)]|uniref:gamma-butyrobetaine hydroxylase-like domain-containing protein n=1 Tax=unclassified Labrys (in: a-proteobacteria) TaxID=2688601 RepID=UPI003EB8FD9D
MWRSERKREDAVSEDVAKAWPTELRLSKDKKTLTVSFDDGRSHAFSAEMLRVMSPSAEVQGHSAAERKTVGGKINVAILSLDPVGNYAVRISFDDMHNTGLFTWTYLAELGREKESRWASYLADLQEKGLSRERPGQR